MAYIYKITNLKNNKIYIGQTIQPIQKRFSQHLYNAKKLQEDPTLPARNRRYNMPISKAIAKYGKNCFTINILEECKSEELNEKEIYYIALFNSANSKYGYNATLGGALSDNMVTENEKDEILMDFNNGMSIRKLKSKYHRKDTTILTLLKYYFTRGLNKNQIYPVVLVQAVIEDYKKTHSMISTADHIGIGRDKVLSILKSQNLYNGKWKKVLCIDKKTDTIVKIYDNQTQAATELKPNSVHSTANHISECCRGKRKTAAGFKWHFDE